MSIYLQWFYRIVVVGVLYRIRSVNFGPYISKTVNQMILDQLILNYLIKIN